jgi:DNA-binding NarL/FixJ family response regulator
MDAFAEALRHAETNEAISETIVDAARRHIGLSSFSFLRVSGPVISPTDVFVLNGRAPSDRARDLFVDMLARFHREMGPFESCFGARRKSLDIAERYPANVMRRLEVYNECWRPLAVERQLVGFLGTNREPVGFFCVARSSRETAFTTKDLEALETMRTVVARALLAARHLGFKRLEDTLSVLSAATPAPWFLFDAGGQLLWLTDEACTRLSAESARIGSSVAFRHSEALERLREWVRSSAHAANSASPHAPQACLLAASSEQFVMRRFETSPGRPVFLVGFADPAPRGTGALGETPGPETTLRAARLARRHDLTPRQTEVLTHLAHGKANKTIAALLGCAEVTVEFHVTGLLSKLDCESRAEAVARFWTS